MARLIHSELPAQAGKGVAAAPTTASIGKFARRAELETRPGVLPARDTPRAPNRDVKRGHESYSGAGPQAEAPLAGTGSETLAGAGLIAEGAAVGSPGVVPAYSRDGASEALRGVTLPRLAGSSHRGARPFGAALILGVCLAWGAMWLLGFAERHVTGNDTGEITILRGAP